MHESYKTRSSAVSFLFLRAGGGEEKCPGNSWRAGINTAQNPDTVQTFYHPATVFCE